MAVRLSLRHAMLLWLLRPVLLALALVLLAMFLLGRASAHDSWINAGGYRNPQGEWCCGEGDCALLDDGTAHQIASPSGFILSGMGTIFGSGNLGNVRLNFNEFVPMAESLPSKDGKFWRCRRPDGSRRCFFYPPPNS